MCRAYSLLPAFPWILIIINSHVNYEARCSRVNYEARCSHVNYEARCSRVNYEARCSHVNYAACGCHVTYEPHRGKTNVVVPTRSNINQPVQSQN